MIKDNNEMSVDIDWDGFNFEFIVKGSESITMYAMHRCGFQILRAKMEGKEIPDGALVMGSPGKVVRMLEPEEQARLLRSAEGYRRNALRYAKGLVALG